MYNACDVNFIISILEFFALISWSLKLFSLTVGNNEQTTEDHNNKSACARTLRDTHNYKYLYQL